MQYGTNVSYEGLSMYYEQEYLSRFETFMLENKKGEEIDEISSNDIKWYHISCPAPSRSS